MKIPNFISIIISDLENAGFSAYAVGGCVRDSLMGNAPSDWDLTTSALPGDILAVFKDKKTLTTGIKHGTVTVIWDKTPVEITTFRIDGSYTDNRHPTAVTFSDNIAEDLKRRDFTVNSMAYNPKTGIIDLFCGEADIRSGIIRAVGDPYIRFSEDALRIMRALRFSAVLNFTIEKNTSDAIFRCRNLLSSIAAERITEEFTKTVTAQAPASVLEKYFAVTASLFFPLHSNADEIKPDFMPMNSIPTDTEVRLAVYLYRSAAALGTDSDTAAGHFFSEMKFSTAIKQNTLAILRLIGTELSPDRIFLRKLLTHYSTCQLQLALAAKQALEPQNKNLQTVQQLSDEIIRNGDCFSIRSLDLKGSDLIEALHLSGMDVGRALNLLLNAVIEEKCLNKKADLLSWLKENI